MKKNKTLIIFIIIVCLFKINIISAETIYKEYKIGDKITYNHMDFYVIEDSDSKKDYVTLLKAEPLSVDEVNKYGIDSNGINHVNRYTYDSIGKAYESNGYGGMEYYTSEACESISSPDVITGCTNSYDASDVKYVVDAWSVNKFGENDLKEDNLGYKARLITKEELMKNLGYNHAEEGPSWFELNPDYTPSWVYNSNYYYWTMSAYEDSNWYVWFIRPNGVLYHFRTFGGDKVVVRPVVNLKKNAIQIKKKLTDKEFKIGDIVEYNNMLFYVIKNSTEKDNSVTLLKAEPLTVDEVNKYGKGHVNMYVDPTLQYYQKARDKNGYGGMAYYASSTCKNYGSDMYEGCTTDYGESEVKYLIDAWALDKFSNEVLTKDATGYNTRLITVEELIGNLDYEIINNGSIFYGEKGENTPSWIYNSNYAYWTMSENEDSVYMWGVNVSGSLDRAVVCFNDYVVRPVVTLKKIDEDNSENVEIKTDENGGLEDELNDSNNNQIIKVPDTHLSKKIIFIVIGVALIIASIIVRYIIIKRLKNNKIDKTA